ncbi:MAG TPA: hypothetical protein VJ719_10045 [Chthoniobacterales bacterium]|nr:hypothetical protein [Chthoniobacterales bacterium]
MKALIILLVTLWPPLADARGEVPAVPELPPTPTPFVTLSPPPVAPRVPPPGRPWFSVVTRDKGSHYEVYATVQKAAPKDVRVEIEGRSLKLLIPSGQPNGKAVVKFVTLPDPAQAAIGKVKREAHAVVINIPKAKNR